MGNIYEIVSLGLLGLASLVISFGLLRYRRFQRDLDDQGIRLIQLQNQQLELKKELGQWVSQRQIQSRQRPVPATSGSSLASEASEKPVSRTTAPAKSVSAKEKSDLSTNSLDDAAPDDSEDHRATHVAYVATDDSSQVMALGSTNSSTGGSTSGSFGHGDDSNSDLSIDGNRIDEQEESRPTQPKTKESSQKEVLLHREFEVYEDFVDEMGANISKMGLFLKSEELLPVGTRVEMRLQLADGASLITGKGEVKRVHFEDGGSSGTLKGMDIRFIYLDQGSKDMVRRLVREL